MEEGAIVIAASAPLVELFVKSAMKRSGLPTSGLPVRDLNRLGSTAVRRKIKWHKISKTSQSHYANFRERAMFGVRRVDVISPEGERQQRASSVVPHCSS